MSKISKIIKKTGKEELIDKIISTVQDKNIPFYSNKAEIVKSLVYDSQLALLNEVKKIIEEKKTKQRDIEPLGGMCLEFADGWDSALGDLLQALSLTNKEE